MPVNQMTQIMTRDDIDEYMAAEWLQVPENLNKLEISMMTPEEQSRKAREKSGWEDK